MAVTIRSGRPADAPAILRVHEESIRKLGTAIYSDAEVESWAAGLAPDGYIRAMTEGGEAFLVAESLPTGIVAFCSYRDSEVCGLYVASSWVRRRIGSNLLRQAETVIAAAGHPRIPINASLTGQAFYEAHGYQVVGKGRRKTRGGLNIDVVDMEKFLAP
ncbi:MAG: GNAT family N-acetyltransferase [Burkholderiales bacterium]